MRKFFIVSLILILSFGGVIPIFSNQTVSATSDFNYTAEQLEALDYLNSIRAKMGLSEVKLNPYLNESAQNHSDYLNINGAPFKSLDIHLETEGKLGYTGVSVTERVRATGFYEQSGYSFDEGISSHTGLIAAIDMFLNSAYHRMALIDPNLKEIGFGSSSGGVVINYYLSTGWYSKPVVYPYEGQDNAEVEFIGNHETPNPLERYDLFKSGGVVSFLPPEIVDKYTFRMIDSKGNEVPCYVGDFAMLFAFPKELLKYDETYTVTVGYDDKVKTWSFKTKLSPQQQSEKEMEERLKLCPDTNAGRIVWGNDYYDEGQIGRITTLKSTPQYYYSSFVSKDLKFISNLPANQTYPVYEIITHPTQGTLYHLGGDYYVKKSSTIKYEVPSQSDLKKIDCNGNKVPLTSDNNGSTTPPTNSNSKGSAYSDFKDNEWWSSDMLWAVDKGLIAGYTNVNSKTGKTESLLKPSDPLTEAQFITVLFRYANPDEMKSMQSEVNWWASVPYQLAGQYNLATNGSLTDRVLADKPITRGKMAELLASLYLGKPVTEREAVQFMYDNNLSSGYADANGSVPKTYESYGADKTLLRAHVASFMKRYDDFLNK